MLPVKNTLLPTVTKFFDDDWNNLFDWSNRSLNLSPRTIPSVNIVENSDHFMIEMAAPGMKKEDFNLELHNNILKVSTERTKTEDHLDDNFARKEFCYDSFQRSFNLMSKVVDSSKISAKYKDGILSIHLPKREEAKEKPVQKIKIS